MFVPFVNFIMMFVLGAKGSKWAWKNRVWADEEHFVRTQRNWARAGFAVIGVIFVLAGLLFYSVFAIMKGNDAYKQTMAQVQSNSQVVEALGTPIQAGWFVTGNIKLNGSEGAAGISVPISGPKNSGTVTSRATKIAGVWDIHLLVVRVDGNPTPIILINKKNIQIPNAARDT